MGRVILLISAGLSLLGSLVSFRLAAFLLVGIAAGWLLHGLIRAMIRRRESVGPAIAMLIGLLLCIGSSFYAGILSPRPRGCAVGSTWIRTTLRDYHATIGPSTPTSDAWSVGEAVTYDEQLVRCGPDHTVQVVTTTETRVARSLPERQVQAEERGLLIREVRIRPLEGTVLPRCCPSAITVEVRDAPRGSFYEAYGVRELHVTPYLDNETATWTYSDLLGDIVFAYLPSPFHALRILITPLVQIAYHGTWVVALLAFLTTSCVIPLAGLLIGRVLDAKLKRALDRERAGKQKRRRRIIVTARGDTKEIEVSGEEDEDSY